MTEKCKCKCRCIPVHDWGYETAYIAFDSMMTRREKRIYLCKRCLETKEVII